MNDKHNSAFWRGQAQKCVQVAREISDPQARAEMLRIAESYDRMAKLADIRGQ